jgi:hypothetical protein
MAQIEEVGDEASQQSVIETDSQNVSDSSTALQNSESDQMPAQTIEQATETTAEGSATVTETPPVDYDRMLRDGKNKKSAGIASTVIGATFMGATIVYSLLFIIDKETFGIPLGSTSGSNYRVDFYLNPGLFGLAVGAPCLAAGIVNMIKGGNMIEDAQNRGKETSVQIRPFLWCSVTKHAAIAGITANF